MLFISGTGRIENNLLEGYETLVRTEHQLNTNQANWKTLKHISEARLYEARGQLHQAAQLLAATGISFLAPRADDSHTAIHWSSRQHYLQSQTFGTDEAFQVTLDPENLQLTVTRSGDAVQDLDLNGITLQQAAEKLQGFLEELGLLKNVFTMQKHYELPDYPDRWNTVFDTSDAEAFRVLAHSYSNAYEVLSRIVNTDPRAGALLIWPHHFDLATLITTQVDEQGNLSGSIGVGLSPGDGSYTAPYYYVTVWPAPAMEQIPDDLQSAGHWHTAGWIGMVLPLNPIADTAAAQQQSVVEHFLNEALSVADSLSK